MCFEGEAKERDRICDSPRPLTNQPGGTGFSPGDVSCLLLLQTRLAKGALAGQTRLLRSPGSGVNDLKRSRNDNEGG